MWDKEKDLEYFMQLWDDKKSSGMSHKKEDWDKRSHGWVQGLNEDEERAKRSEERVSETGRYLRSKGLLGPGTDVIDIGCGPGRFVAEFARTAGSATGTDLSTEMCRYGQEYADSLGLKNVIYTPCDFKAADLDQMGWRNRFHLVFSSITPAMNSLDSLWKSIEMSRGWCFQSNFIKAEDDLADAAFSEVIPDITRLERSPRITYTLVNILWLKGYLPEVTYYTEESFRRENAETLAESILKQAPEAYASDEIRRKMIEALNKRADKDGMVERHSTVTYSWVLWDTRKR